MMIRTMQTAPAIRMILIENPEAAPSEEVSSVNVSFQMVAPSSVVPVFSMAEIFSMSRLQAGRAQVRNFTEKPV